MSDLMSNFNIKDKSGTLHQYEIKDASARQEIESAKDLDFDENQFEITETDTEVKIKVNVFSGATNVSEAGVGLVPSATLDDTNKYLKGDGTWATVENLTQEQKEILEIIKSSPVTGTYTLKCIDGNLQWIEETS